MISTYQRLQRQRDAGEIDGFTLIELLIVIVVLGILAAVVIFALGGITGKSALASCQADGATVSTALAAFNAQNPTLLSNVSGTGTTTAPTVPIAYGTGYTYYYDTGTAYNTTVANAVGTMAVGTVADNTTMETLLSATTNGGPYVQSWPNSASHYGFVLVWTQTTLAVAAGTSPVTAAVPATWSAQLYVVTGDTYATGPVYTPSVVNGNLSQAIINAAIPTGNTPAPTTGTPIVALLSYAGPTSCAGVS
jgi:general secretion pathway protein G